MNIRQDRIDAPPDEAFDARLRQCHAQSLAHLSPRVQAQLALRRRATATPRRAGWIAAGSVAAALALVVGLQLRPQPGHAVLPADALATTPAPVAADADSAYAAYDENPDFYLWLASSDATTLASE